MNTSVTEDDIYRHLKHYDDIYGEKYLPAIVFVSILMTMGIIGNSLVCFVYLVKFRSSTIRCFIVSLAVLDLMNCFISCPFDIADMRYRYTFGSYTTMCKMMRIFVTFTSVSSALILIPVAVDRYKKICHPLKKQMTRLRAKVAIAICCGIGAVVAAPAAIFYGPRTVETDIASVNGSDCSTPDRFVNTKYPLIYNAANLVVFFTSAITLIVLYSLIWRAIKKHTKFRRSNLASNVQSNSSSKSESKSGKDADHSGAANNGSSLELSSSPEDERSTKPVFSDVSQKTSAVQGTITTASQGTVEHKESETKKEKEASSRDKRKSVKSRHEMGVRKTTFMLFLITLVFVLSYLPHLGLMATRALHKQIFDDINNVQFGAFYFFFKSYFINSAFNPIIYSFCNEKFRHELLGILKSFRCRCC